MDLLLNIKKSVILLFYSRDVFKMVQVSPTRFVRVRQSVITVNGYLRNRIGRFSKNKYTQIVPGNEGIKCYTSILNLIYGIFEILFGSFQSN